MRKEAGRPGGLRRLGRAVRQALLTLVLLGVLIGGLAVGLLYREVTATLPPVEELANYRPPLSTQILADDGAVVGEFFVEKRYVVPIERIPAVVRNAFLAAEDDGFYEHPGIDPRGIVRAFLSNLAAGGTVQGGSTITQQVVKQLLLSPEKSYERKIREILLALRLEQQLSKDQILFLYLNHIYLGSGAHGVAAAALEYFGKPVEELGLAEAAMLAGLPQAPSRYSPFRHWDKAKARQRYVLERMAAVGFVTGAEAILADREPLSLATRRRSFVEAPHYVEHVRRLLDERYGSQAAYRMGLRVHTALRREWQQAAEEALTRGLREIETRQKYDPTLRSLDEAGIAAFLAQAPADPRTRGFRPDRPSEAVVVGVEGRRVTLGVGPWRGHLTWTRRRPPRRGDVLRVRLAEGENEPEDDTPASRGAALELDDSLLVQGAMVALDPRTGDVKALVGGADFRNSQFNRATQALRQPGSSFKPFVYAAAFDGEFTPASVILDAPVSYPDNNKSWSPQNYENRFYGPTTLREALTFSRNVPTVKLAHQIGVRRLVTFVRSLGITSPLAPNLSLSLGAAEVTPLELVSAYSVFASGGERASPRFITRITDSEGVPIDETEPRRQTVLSPETAYLVTSVLQDVIERGTGRRARALGRPAAGKTGTTNDNQDAWFVGYTPQLVAGFWVGFDGRRSLGRQETGGLAVAPMWLEFMRVAMAQEPILDFPIPASLTMVTVDAHSGQRAVPGSPGTILEAFRRGTEPTWRESPDQPAPDGGEPPSIAVEAPGIEAEEDVDDGF